MTVLILFVSTFALVFGLGLQSLNVNGGHYKAAFMTSFLIGSMQMIMLKLGPDADWFEIIGYLSGGPFGIVASMHFHRYAIRKKHRQQTPPRRNPPPFDIE